MLTLFHQGIYIPEYQTTVPWLITEPELTLYIPRENILYSIAHWPGAEFTLFGLKKKFSFNFVTHKEGKLVEVQFYNDNKETMHRTLTEFSSQLRSVLGKPNEVDLSDSIMWMDESITIINTLSEGETDEGFVIYHMFSIFFNYREEEQNTFFHNMNWEPKFFDVLREYGMSPCEHSLMCVVGYRLPLLLDELPEYSATLDSSCSESEYADASRSCIQKGWLEILTAEWREREAERQQSSQIPKLLDEGFEHGVVDFTQEGYLLFRKINLRIFGEEHIQYDESGWNIDERSSEVNIYAETESLCRKRAKEFKDEPSSYIGETVNITSISYPTMIGPWKPNRFITLPQGFHIKITYRILAG